MTTQRDKTLDSLLIGSLTLGLFLYWSLKVIGPFLTVALWSAILTVALYPLFDWLAARLGSRRLAATLINLLCLVIVIGPVTWLGFGLIGSVDFAIRGFDSKIFSIPSPAESIKDWPLIGEPVYRLWTLAATDIKTILLEVLPRLKPLGSKLLEVSGTVVFGLLEFVAAIIISGFLYSPGPRLADSLGAILR
jgi:predicted PurR-regulated permease PerM